MYILEPPSPVDPGLNTTRNMRVAHPYSFTGEWELADPDCIYNLYLISETMLQTLCFKYNRNIILFATAFVYTQTHAPRLISLI